MLALADAGGHDPREISGLLLLEHQTLVVGEELGGIALAGEGAVRVSLRVDADALVDPDELDLRVRLGGLGRVAAEGEADGHDDVVVLADERVDVLGVVSRLGRHHGLGSGCADSLRSGLRALPGELVEVVVVERANVGHDADLEVAGRSAAGIPAAPTVIPLARGQEHDGERGEGCAKGIPMLPHELSFTLGV